MFFVFLGLTDRQFLLTFTATSSIYFLVALLLLLALHFNHFLKSVKEIEFDQNQIILMDSNRGRSIIAMDKVERIVICRNRAPRLSLWPKFHYCVFMVRGESKLDFFPISCLLMTETEIRNIFKNQKIDFRSLFPLFPTIKDLDYFEIAN